MDNKKKEKSEGEKLAEKLLSDKKNGGLRLSEEKIKKADKYCEIADASATPTTPSWQTMTKNRFSAIFTPPAIAKKVNGFFVSPMALKTALPKLYSASAGIPRK